MTVLALVAVLLATPYIGMAHATAPTSVLFGAPFSSITSLYAEYKQIGPNWVLHDGVRADLIGDVVGTMTSDARWVLVDWMGPDLDPGMLTVTHGNGHVSVTVDPATIDDKTGTFTMMFNDVPPTALAGTWTIIGGTGDLKNIHGQGTWVIPGFVDGVPCQVFEGQIHFDP